MSASLPGSAPTLSGDMGMATWAAAGVTPLVIRDPDRATGAAGIFIEETEGRNAIVISPGAAAAITVADIEARADEIGAAKVAVTQLEQPVEGGRAVPAPRVGGRGHDGVQTPRRPRPCPRGC